MKKLALVLTIAITIVSASATQVMAQAKPASVTPSTGKISSTPKLTNLIVQDIGGLHFKLAF